MSDTNALREAVARASWESTPTFGPPERLHQRTPWDELDDVAKEMVRENNDAAIAAVLDHLIAEAESHTSGQQPIGSSWGWQWAFLAAWLRSFQEAEQ